MRRIVYFVGDVHGAIGKLNEFIDREIRSRKIFECIAHDCRVSGQDFGIDIIQVGDFGYFWPGWNNFGRIDNRLDFLPGGRVNIWWCGGNHDDWDEIDSRLERAPGGIAEVDAGVFLCGFGAALEMPGDKIVLFCGGAESVDREARIMKMAQGEGKCWWKREGVSEEDMAKLDAVPRADIVVSHTAPLAFDVEGWIVGNGYGHIRHNQASRIALDRVLDRFSPERWFFGHFHEWMKGNDRGCEWMGLADLARGHEAWMAMDFED